MNEIERLLVSTFPLLVNLLEKYGEFFPLASAIKTNNTLVQEGTYEGDEQPPSNTMLANFKSAFKANRDDYNAITIFFDVRVMNPNTNSKTDAVAVFAEMKKDSVAFNFYYPYVLSTNNKLTFSEPWSTEVPKEIFID